MPIKLKKTSSTSVVTGNSVLFNGSNQYLTIPYNSNLWLGSSNWTIECWVYLNSLSTYNQIWEHGYGASNTIRSIVVYMEITTGLLRIAQSSDGSTNYDTSLGITLTTNSWKHVAIVRNGANVTAYLNGIAGTSVTAYDLYNSTTRSHFIGLQGDLQAITAYNGYISNHRVVKGTALYTSNFTPPTSPLTAIPNTSLLTCQSATIIDNSSNNFTITNNGGATVSSAITPFSSSLAYGGTNFKKNIYPRVGRSVQFNGGGQYLSVASNAAFNLTGDYTAEFWVYHTTAITDVQDYILIDTPGSFGLGVNATGVFIGRRATAIDFQSTATLASNTWYHLAFSRSGITTRIFVNGVQAASNTTTTYSYAQAAILVGGFVVGGTSNLKGYISNVRILKGTALYTSNFTPSTSPLTAIANTSLLTCQSPTIIDNSSNNFTITNNNTAVVSTTNPFGADTTGGGMGMKKSAAVVYLTQKAIFGYGNNGATYYSVTNLVSNTGVVANDTTGVGTARNGPAAAGYGSDKAIFGYGQNGSSTNVSMTNLVSNTGVMATDTTGVGTARFLLAAAGYGNDKAIFGYGLAGASVSITNLVSNTGVVAGDTTGVGTARYGLAAAKYGTDKAIFGYGNGPVSMTNLVSNAGVVSTDTSGVGTSKYALAAAGYGTNKAIFGYGYTSSNSSITNLVSNTGVVATDTTGVGTSRYALAAAGYGSDKAIFGYGQTTVALSMTNLVSNTGVVSTDTTGVGTVRNGLTAAGYSLT
jgi:hypothetical protein